MSNIDLIITTSRNVLQKKFDTFLDEISAASERDAALFEEPKEGKRPRSDMRVRELTDIKIEFQFLSGHTKDRVLRAVFLAARFGFAEEEDLAQLAAVCLGSATKITKAATAALRRLPEICRRPYFESLVAEYEAWLAEGGKHLNSEEFEWLEKRMKRLSNG